MAPPACRRASDIIERFPRDARKRPSPLKHYRRILGYVRPYRGVFACAIVGMLLVASTDVMLLRSSSRCSTTSAPSTPMRCGGCPSRSSACSCCAASARTRASTDSRGSARRVVFDLRCEACDHLLRLPTPFYDATSAGFLLSRITFDAQQIAATASEAITVSIRNTLTIAFMLGYLLYLNWQLTLIAFAACRSSPSRCARSGGG